MFVILTLTYLRRAPLRLYYVVLAAGVLALPACKTRSVGSHVTERVTPTGVEQLAVKGGTNGAAISQAARSLPQDQREGLEFLLGNMPERDLQQLSPSLLVENVALAYETFAKAPWRDRVPKEIFLNDILPYACVNETRDAWRGLLREKCEPLVADCQTPAEAAQRLNQKLFKLVNVRYSTGRKKADQSPLESMESGLATCTGLSILLVDACRSVGVPARLAGTPMWTNMRGNHT